MENINVSIRSAKIYIPPVSLLKTVLIWYCLGKPNLAQKNFISWKSLKWVKVFQRVGNWTRISFPLNNGGDFFKL